MSDDAKAERFKEWVRNHAEFYREIVDTCRAEFGMSPIQVKAEFQRMAACIRLAPPSKYNYRSWRKFIRTWVSNCGRQRVTRAMPEDVRETRIHGL